MCAAQRALRRKSRALMQEARIDSPLRLYGGGATMPLLAATPFGSTDRVGAIVKANEIVCVRATVRNVVFLLLQARLTARRFDIRRGAGASRSYWSGCRRLQYSDGGKSNDEETMCALPCETDRKAIEQGELHES